MPKISVIVPVYNTEKYLSKCLDSLLGQTLSDIEIICINDGSTDNSSVILNRYAKKDNRVTIIDFKRNKGVSIARNTGINTAVGEYIGFVDSDDFIDLEFYEKLYKRAKETGADTIKGNIYDYDIVSGTAVLTDFYNINDKIIKNKAYFCYGFTSAIYKTAFIRKYHIDFPEGISHFEDPYFSIKASLYYNKVETVNDALYYYARRDDSACSLYADICGVMSFLKGIKTIFDMINQADESRKDYLIHTTFLLELLIPFCKNMKYPTTIVEKLAQTLSYIIENSKLSTSEVLTAYFLTQKSNLVRKNIRILRKNKGEE